MTSKTITDRAGDTLRVSTGSLTALPSEVTIKVIENARDRRHVAAVHVDPAALRAALDGVAPLGKYTRTTPDPDDMDGGVAAALIEKEAEQPLTFAEGLGAASINARQAREAEKDAKHLRDRCAELEHRLHLAVMASDHNSERAEKAERERDEARGALRARLGVLTESHPLTPDAITDEAMRRAVKAWEETGELRPAIFAAITAPARPEGAEEIEALLAGSWPIDREGLSAAADDLAMNGVRVVSEDGAR